MPTPAIVRQYCHCFVAVRMVCLLGPPPRRVGLIGPFSSGLVSPLSQLSRRTQSEVVFRVLLLFQCFVFVCFMSHLIIQ